jgi:hypothetical protein
MRDKLIHTNNIKQESIIKLNNIQEKEEEIYNYSLNVAAAVDNCWLQGVGTNMESVPTPCETGFINSQPSMAEFMTALPPHISGDTMRGSDRVSSPGDSPVSSGVGGFAGLGVDQSQDRVLLGTPGQTQGAPGVNVPEYPWMKEKKTTRKSNAQG